ASGTYASVGTLLRYSLQTGQTEIVHTNAAVQTTAYEDARSLELTPDGRYLVFVANTNGTTGITTCILRWDGETGGMSLVSANLSNQVSTASICDWPTLDASGRYVAFLSSAANMVTNTVVGDFHLYLRDVDSGTTALIDAEPNGVGSAAMSPATLPRLSADARFVAFESTDANLVANDRNRDADVFVRDLAGGATELISTHDPALASLTANGPSMLNSANALSSDGRYLVFATEADNLGGNDTNGCRDIFVRNLAAGTNLLVSVATNGWTGDSVSSEPTISPEGQFVAFTSSADNLVAGDSNKAQDVFVRDLQSGTTTLVSVNSTGTGPGNNDSYSPVVSAGGRYVLFRSKATNLATGLSSTENLFLRDLQAGATYALTTLGASGQPAVMTPDGRWVAFGGAFSYGSTYSYLYMWNTQAAQRSYTNTLQPSVSLSRLAMTPDGQRVAYVFGTTAARWLYVAVPQVRTSLQIESVTALNTYADLRLSADGRYLAYSRAPLTGTGAKQVYLYDLQAGASVLVSHAYDNGATLGDGASDYLDLSSNGRFLAYRSISTNLVALDTNGVPDIFLYDRQTGNNTLLSASRYGWGSGNNRSLTPIFSADGQTLAFQSWASDLVAGDCNHNGDVFAYTLLTMSLLPAAAADQGPLICWPVMPGKSYRVQFKNSLTDADWQDLAGAMTTVGTKAYLQDLAPANTQRFYRVVAF
ncbi:MAG TPA: hypothetical protein VNT26_00635, partial [Candidatus Sulfotelmatobacter sp.]|nr:hypothetical protein [Candidatus Sulfotelmatobacter sp.]